MKVIKTLFKRVILATLSLLTIPAFAVPIQVEVFRKKNGTDYSYRICVSDWHEDYVDGRSRKKHHAQLFKIAKELQKTGKTVRFIVEDSGHYTGPDQGLAQTLQKINNIVRHTEEIWQNLNQQPASLNRGGLLVFITEGCQREGLPCHNIEFRYPQAVMGSTYVPTYKKVFDNLKDVHNQLSTTNFLQKNYKPYVDFLNFYKRNVCKQYPTQSNDVVPNPVPNPIFTFANCLFDAQLIHALHEEDQRKTDYVFVITGGLHLEKIHTLENDLHYWQKAGYELVNSTEIVSPALQATLNHDLIVTQADQADLEKIIVPYLDPAAPAQKQHVYQPIQRRLPKNIGYKPTRNKQKNIRRQRIARPQERANIKTVAKKAVAKNKVRRAKVAPQRARAQHAKKHAVARNIRARIGRR